MKSIIIGAGDVGLNIARHLVLENRDVVIIDSSLERLAVVNETVDVQTIHGKGSHPDVLERAGAGNADMLIAVTQSDEVNMVACQMAYSLFNVPKKIARVRHS
ncbi:MAG: Trk system potassium uptake protein TrkA, partial [Proteobacteria bacterium]